MSRLIAGITYWSRQDWREWEKHLWMKSNLSRLLEIDFDRTYPNELGSSTIIRFGISKYDQFQILMTAFHSHWMIICETISRGFNVSQL